MGDPRRFKGKYSGPIHPWQRSRIEEEFVLVREFGLKTKRELWKITSKLKVFSQQAKRLIALRTSQAELEGKQLIERVSRLGLLTSSAKLNDVLGLSARDLLNRRLQNVILKCGFARSPNQARQFIVHGHILVSGKKVTSPNYLVPIEQESLISFVGNSTLANPEHPERVLRAKKVEVVEKAGESEKSKSEKSRSKFDKKPRVQKGGKK